MKQNQKMTLNDAAVSRVKLLIDKVKTSMFPMKLLHFEPELVLIYAEIVYQYVYYFQS